MPYQITCAKFYTFEDDYQTLAVGLVDGAIVIIDMLLGIEKHFLEKHPSSISTLAFYENRALISGSICGRVNISDLESLDLQKANESIKNLKFSMCQNCQDRRIPVANVSVSDEFGMAIAIDIEGNCRFYDLHRFKKMAKVNAANIRIDDDLNSVGNAKFRMLDNVCLEMTNDSFIGII